MSRRRTSATSLLVGLVILCISLAQQKGWLTPALKQAEKSQPGLYKVVKFTDGDTISVNMNGTTESVRLIGVDTPETHDPRKEVQCYGETAANFTKQLIGTNAVRLEADPINTNRDRYDRLLRYVYLPDGRLVNAEIIKQGYGFAYTYFPFTKLEEFKSYQTEAEQQGLGLWGNCQVLQQWNGQIQTNSN